MEIEILIVATDTRRRRKIIELLQDAVGTTVRLCTLEANCVEQAEGVVQRRCPGLVCADSMLALQAGGLVEENGLELAGRLEGMAPVILFSDTEPSDQEKNMLASGLIREFLVLHRAPMEFWQSAIERILSLQCGGTALLGESPEMKRLKQDIDLIAPENIPVWVEGESGSGKTLVAELIHRKSGRGGRFIHQNCSAIPENLFESKLFGHVRGAFTGADKDHPGLFQQAHGGTLFLDEIGEMPLTQQPRLLVALESARIRPVGSDREVEVDVRIIAATNRDINEAMQLRAFREDLYARLEDEILHIPPLRNRGQDVILLAEHFIAEYRRANNIGRHIGLSSELQQRMLAYNWPRNVRELNKLLMRALRRLTPDAGMITDLPGLNLPAKDLSEADFFKQCDELINQGLTRSEVAKKLGISYPTLYRRLRQRDAAGRP